VVEWFHLGHGFHATWEDYFVEPSTETNIKYGYGSILNEAIARWDGDGEDRSAM